MGLETRLEIVMDLAAAMGALLYAGAVLARSPREPLRVRLGLLLLALGLAHGCRGAHAAWGLGWALHLQYLGFGTFPLLALLYGEAASGRRTPFLLRLLALVMTVFFAVTWPTALVERRAWLLVMMSYQLTVLAAVAAGLLGSAWSQRSGPRRSALFATGALAAIAGGAVLTENRDGLGWAVPRLGAGGVLLVAYVAACTFHVGGVWSVRAMVARLWRPVAAGAALALLLGSLVPAVGGEAQVFAVVLPVLGFLVFDPTLAGRARRAHRQTAALLGRLAQLGPRDLRGYLGELGAWPEIRSAAVIPAERLHAEGYDGLARHFAAHPGPADRERARATLACPCDHGETRAAEQVLDLLDRRGCDFLLILPDDSALTVTLDGFHDLSPWRPVLQLLGELCRLRPALPEDGR